ncbi:hypothetical protein BH20CHL4_BH20CHL4_15410 [soil metagenome]
MDGFIGAGFGLAAGAVFIVLGLLLTRRGIAPSRWKINNIQNGRNVVITGTILIICGLAGLAALHDPRQQHMLVLVCLFIMILGLGYSVFAGHRIARRLTRPDNRWPLE